MPCHVSTFFLNPDVPGFMPAIGLVGTSMTAMSAVALHARRVVVGRATNALDWCGEKASDDKLGEHDNNRTNTEW